LTTPFLFLSQLQVYTCRNNERKPNKTKDLSNDARIDGLLTTTNATTSPVVSWQSTNEIGTAVALDVSFLSSATNGVSGLAAMDASLQADTMIALQNFSDVANISFTFVAAGQGDLNFGTAQLLGTSAGITYTGYSYYPQYAWYTNANVYLTNAFNSYDEANVGDSSYTMLLHEIAHSLGIEHPFEGILVPNGTDNDQYTLMSYTGYYPSGSNPTSLMLYDTMALQAPILTTRSRTMI